MSRRIVPYVIVGIVSYLIFIVATVPAALLGTALQRASNGTLVLQALSGTAWNGRGELVLNRGHAGVHSFGQGHWSVNPLWLFTGSVRTSMKFSAPDSDIAATVNVSPGKLSIARLQAKFSASLVGALYAPAALVAPEGSMVLESGGLSFEKDALKGEAKLDWRNAASNLSPVKPLGDYRLSASGQGKAMQVKMETLTGALALSGTGQWRTDDGRLHFDLLAKARERADELGPLLKMIGREQANGDRLLTIDVRLR